MLEAYRLQPKAYSLEPTAEGRKSEPSMKRKHVTVSSDEESDSDIRHHNKEKGKKVKYNEKPISEAYGSFK